MLQRFILNISEEGTLILAPVTPVEGSQGIVFIFCIKGVKSIISKICHDYLVVGTNSQFFLFSLIIILT